MPSDPLMPLRMRYTSPMFAPHLRNVHDATMNNNARTNNICEGWNNKFFNLDAVGNPPQRRVCRRYVQLQESLRNLCVARREDHKTVTDFLRDVGWNIRLNHQH
ncbi:hypothetical protein Hamer_G002506 [Homarus americanus]|uniref:Uncharacterized protein n=1 Tax=Homarus americanus TaxID=6706 RepID=A0A8J5K8D0_HOMAM|nr:hypothetical protein Hamer_G002506 [Homarus americanus]